MQDWIEGHDQFIGQLITGKPNMNEHNQYQAILYLTAVHNDLKTYLANPNEFDEEFFVDIEEAVAESLRLLER